MEEDKRQKKTTTSVPVDADEQCEADQPSSDQSASMSRSAEVSSAEFALMDTDDLHLDPWKLNLDLEDTVWGHLLKMDIALMVKDFPSSSEANDEAGHNHAAEPNQGQSIQDGLPAIEQLMNDGSEWLPMLIPYHANMARKYPGAESRTPKQQARRDKNNVYTRIYRYKKRMEKEALQQAVNEEEKKNADLKALLALYFKIANDFRSELGLEILESIEQLELEMANLASRPRKMLDLPNPTPENAVNDQSNSNDQSDSGVVPESPEDTANETTKGNSNANEPESAAVSEPFD